MNKASLVSSIAEKSGLTKKDSEAALNAFMASVEESLVNGEKVSLVGFMTFELRDQKARQGRNPQNPEQIIEIPACKRVKVKIGKSLKDKIKSL